MGHRGGKARPSRGAMRSSAASRSASSMPSGSQQGGVPLGAPKPRRGSGDRSPGTPPEKSPVLSAGERRGGRPTLGVSPDSPSAGRGAPRTRRDGEVGMTPFSKRDDAPRRARRSARRPRRRRSRDRDRRVRRRSRGPRRRPRARVRCGLSWCGVGYASRCSGGWRRMRRWCRWRF